MAEESGRPLTGHATRPSGSNLSSRFDHSAGIADATGLETVARTIEGWLEWDLSHRRAEGLATEDGTHLMSLPVPYWPSHGQLRRWIDLFRRTAQAIDARQRQDAETGLVRKDEHAVGETDAPKTFEGELHHNLSDNDETKLRSFIASELDRQSNHKE